METETIDKLFLELSQVTKAKTEKELFLHREKAELEKRLRKATALVEIKTAAGKDLFDLLEECEIKLRKAEDERIRLSELLINERLFVTDIRDLLTARIGNKFNKAALKGLKQVKGDE